MLARVGPQGNAGVATTTYLQEAPPSLQPTLSQWKWGAAVSLEAKGGDTCLGLCPPCVPEAGWSEERAKAPALF